MAEASRWQLVPRNAVARVELPRIPHRPVAVLNRWAIRRLLVIYESQPAYPLPALAVLGGLRCGELLRLYWADADFDHECVIARRNLTPVPGRGMVLGQTKIHQEHRVDLGPIGLAALFGSGGRIRWRRGVVLRSSTPAGALCSPTPQAGRRRSARFNWWGKAAFDWVSPDDAIARPATDIRLAAFGARARAPSGQ